jgi:hypothetical protein
LAGLLLGAVVLLLGWRLLLAGLPRLLKLVHQ